MHGLSCHRQFIYVFLLCTASLGWVLSTWTVGPVDDYGGEIPINVMLIAIERRPSPLQPCNTIVIPWPQPQREDHGLKGVQMRLC